MAVTRELSPAANRCEMSSSGGDHPNFVSYFDLCLLKSLVDGVSHVPSQL